MGLRDSVKNWFSSSNDSKNVESLEEYFTYGVHESENEGEQKKEGTENASSSVDTDCPDYNALFKRNRYDPVIKSYTDFYSRMQFASWPNQFDIAEEDAPEDVQKYLDYLVYNTNLQNLWCGMATRQICLTGGCFVELLWNKKSKSKRTRINNFAIRTPYQMDFKRIKEGLYFGSPDLNQYGEFKGFVYDLGNGEEVDYENFTEMVYLRIGQPDVGTYGIGFVEPIMNDLTLREYVEQAISTNALRMTRPDVDVVYKTIDGHVVKGSKKIADDYAKAKAGFYSENCVRSRYTSRPDILEVSVDWGQEIPEQYVQYLDYTGALIAVSFGFPADFGTFSKKTKMTAEQMDTFFVTLRGFQREMDLQGFLENIIYQRFKKHYTVRFKYREISVDLYKEETMRLMRLIKVNALDPNNPAVQKEVADREGIYLAETIRGDKRQDTDE